MAALNGLLVSPILYEVSSGYSTPILDSKVRFPNFISGLYIPPRPIGALATHQPVATPSKALSAVRGQSFLLDYYYRTHINPIVLNVGNLLSTQLRPVEVWNANFLPNLLTDIVEVDTDGTELTGVTSPPIVYAPLESRVYTANVSTDGPATINAKYIFHFALEDYLPTLSIVGLRILAWWLKPNWSTPIIERWEWLTNVMTSKNRKEQRVKLRGKPRRQFEYAAMVVNNKQRQLAENLLFAWQSRTFGVPIWTDQETLHTPLASGDIFIPCNTFSRDYRVGGLVAILDNELFEIATIASIASDGVTVNSPLISSWVSGSKVAPMRTARMNDKQKFVRQTDTVLTMTVQFSFDDEDDSAPLVETADYLGYPVLEVRPNWREEIDTEYMRDITLIDFMTGKILADDTSGVSTAVNQYHWQAKDRSKFNELRAFLFARFGKLVPLWVPTFLSDLNLVELVAASSAVIYVGNTEYTRNIALAVQRRDIRIQLYDGTLIYRRILETSEVDGNERMVLNAVVGVTIRPSDVRMISFMTLSRMEADAIECKWETDSVVEVSAALRTLRDDV